MVEIWARKDELETADLKRVLHAASALEDDPSSPTHLRAFAWHLVVETHRAAGWDLPSDVSLASCRAAAASLSHASSLLINEISEQVHGVEGPVLLLGALGASRSAFGRWDLLPADGAFLIALDDEDEATSTTLSEAHGIHWAAPGRLRSIYGANSFPVALNGDQVLVPLPALVAARGASRALRPEDPEALLFCGAALEAASSDSWPEVMRIAKSLGNGTAPIDLAVQLGIDTRLGLEVGKVRRSMLALHRLLRR
jgi:hypothetical protein